MHFVLLANVAAQSICAIMHELASAVNNHKIYGSIDHENQFFNVEIDINSRCIWRVLCSMAVDGDHELSECSLMIDCTSFLLPCLPCRRKKDSFSCCSLHFTMWKSSVQCISVDSIATERLKIDYSIFSFQLQKNLHVYHCSYFLLAVDSSRQHSLYRRLFRKKRAKNVTPTAQCCSITRIHVGYATANVHLQLFQRIAALRMRRAQSFRDRHRGKRTT